MKTNGRTNDGGKIRIHVDPDLADLIPGFLKNRRNDLAAMQEALARAEYDTIRILGHSMKGAGGGYGFDAITDIGAVLEQAARDMNPDAVRKGLQDLCSYLNRVEVVND